MISSGRLAKFLVRKREWFEGWRDPNEFSQRIEQIDRVIDSSFLFNRTGNQWFLDALVLSDYIKIEKPGRVRLNRRDPPDANVFKQGTTIPIEITEVLEPGRRRGLEYRWNDASIPVRWGTIDNRGVNSEDLERRAGEITTALKDRITKKVSKKYSPTTILLVYLNMSARGFRQAEVRSKICSVLSDNFGFADIAVLWNGKMFSCSVDRSVGHAARRHQHGAESRHEGA